MNLDAKGTAIPIKKSDALSGAVVFRILGPVNLTWNDITRRHPSFWRHTKWYNNTKFLHNNSIACANSFYNEEVSKLHPKNSPFSCKYGTI